MKTRTTIAIFFAIFLSFTSYAETFKPAKLTNCRDVGNNEFRCTATILTGCKVSNDGGIICKNQNNRDLVYIDYALIQK